MKINDILSEDVAAAGSNDYQKMQDFVRANQTQGVPPDQQIALALFKELQKQKAQNTQLSAELDAADERIDLATQSNSLQNKELGTHRNELERERQSSKQQQAAIGQLDQQTAARQKASQEQIDGLTSRLEAIKNQPGIGDEAAAKLEKQIQALDQKGVSIDKFQELEQSINQVQQLQQVDDEVVQDLAAQVQDAQETAKELSKTKQDMSTELGKEAAAAQDRIDALTREIEELRTLAAAVEPAITDVIQPKLQQIDTKVKELDGENEDIYNELGQHDLEIRKLSGQGGGGGGAGPGNLGTPPPAPAPEPLPQTGQEQDSEEDARARANAAIVKAQLASLKQPTPSKQPEAIAESRMFKAIKWATGKTK